MAMTVRLNRFGLRSSFGGALLCPLRSLLGPAGDLLGLRGLLVRRIVDVGINDRLRLAVGESKTAAASALKFDAGCELMPWLLHKII